MAKKETKVSVEKPVKEKKVEKPIAKEPKVEVKPEVKKPKKLFYGGSLIPILKIEDIKVDEKEMKKISLEDGSINILTEAELNLNLHEN